MDGRFKTEFDRSELIALVRELRRELKTAHQRIASLKKRVEELSKRSPATRLDESYSLQAEERRREKQHNQKRRQKSLPSEIIAARAADDAGKARPGGADRSRLPRGVPCW